LADKAGVAVKTIIRFEAVDGIPPSRTSTLLHVKTALEAAGIEFIGSLTDRPGIRFDAGRMSVRRRARFGSSTAAPVIDPTRQLDT